MTYQEFIEWCRMQQRVYIREQRAIMKQAAMVQDRVRNDDYHARKVAFAPLGLHALDDREIETRIRELDAMEQRIPEQYKDDAVMRFSYDRWLEQQPQKQKPAGK